MPKSSTSSKPPQTVPIKMSLRSRKTRIEVTHQERVLANHAFFLNLLYTAANVKCNKFITDLSDYYPLATTFFPVLAKDCKVGLPIYEHKSNSNLEFLGIVYNTTLAETEYGILIYIVHDKCEENSSMCYEKIETHPLKLFVSCCDPYVFSNNT